MAVLSKEMAALSNKQSKEFAGLNNKMAEQTLKPCLHQPAFGGAISAYSAHESNTRG